MNHLFLDGLDLQQFQLLIKKLELKDNEITKEKSESYWIHDYTLMNRRGITLAKFSQRK